jgi:hypothetical protein
LRGNGRTILRSGHQAQAWDLADGRRIVRDDGGEEDGMFYPPTFSADGRRVALGSAGGLALLHDGASGRRVHVIHGHWRGQLE